MYYGNLRRILIKPATIISFSEDLQLTTINMRKVDASDANMWMLREKISWEHES